MVQSKLFARQWIVQMLLRLCKKVEIFIGLGGHGLNGFGLISCIVVFNAFGSHLLS